MVYQCVGDVVLVGGNFEVCYVDGFQFGIVVWVDCKKWVQIYFYVQVQFVIVVVVMDFQVEGCDFCVFVYVGCYVDFWCVCFVD